MLKLDTPVRLDLRQFFRWWAGELAFLVPARLRKLFGAGTDYLMLIRDGHGLAATHRSAAGERPLGRFTLDEAGSRVRDRLLEERPELAEARLLLRLTAEQALFKTVKLPLAAEENLQQVLAFEMDRLTPFKSDQVYFAARVINRSPATRQITVELILTPRSKLDALLDELAEWGWRPVAVDMADRAPPGVYNLLPEKYRPADDHWLKTLNTVLAAMVVALLISLAVLPIWTTSSEIAQLEEQIRKVGKTAKEVDALRQETETLLHQAQFLQEKKRTEPLMLDMLEQLTRVMPDDTWLNGLQYKDRKIVIQGQSPSASSLIERIEASPYFKNTSFVSPVTKDTTNGLERFQIASEVINARSSEKPAADPADPAQ